MKKAIIWTVCVVAVIGLIALGNGAFSTEDNDTTIPTLTSADADDLAKRLAAAEQAHGICYGWEVLDVPESYSARPRTVTMGSSRGNNIPAKSCPRYVSLSSSITYTSADSVVLDHASLRVEASPDLHGERPSSLELDRMGITDAALMAEPTSTTGYGALALPLLLAEKGVVPPLPAAAASGAPPPVPVRQGSDFTGNRGGQLTLVIIFGSIALAGGLLGATVRTLQRREERRSAT